jgi:hypothetical protein
LRGLLSRSVCRLPIEHRLERRLISHEISQQSVQVNCEVGII